MALAHRIPLARRPATRPFLASSAGGRPVAAAHRAPTASPAGRRGRRAAGVLRGTVARRLAGGPRLRWTALGARDAVLVFVSRRAAGNHGGDDDPARHRGRKAWLHWQVQLAAWIHMLLPPGTSRPGEHEACRSPQLTSQPRQLPLGDDFGALLQGPSWSSLRLLVIMGGAGSGGILALGGPGVRRSHCNSSRRAAVGECRRVSPRRSLLAAALAVPRVSSDAVPGRSGRDFRLQRCGRGDIGLRFGRHCLVLLGKAAAVERPGALRLQA